MFLDGPLRLFWSYKTDGCCHATTRIHNSPGEKAVRLAYILLRTKAKRYQRHDWEGMVAVDRDTDRIDRYTREEIRWEQILHRQMQ